MAEQQVSYRVATISPDVGRRWALHEQEFATERETEVWAVARLFPGSRGVVWGVGTQGLHVGGGKRSTNAVIVRVVDGAPQMPPWMVLEHKEDEGDG